MVASVLHQGGQLGGDDPGRMETDSDDVPISQMYALSRKFATAGKSKGHGVDTKISKEEHNDSTTESEEDDDDKPISDLKAEALTTKRQSKGDESTSRSHRNPNHYPQQT